jgi:ubiquinone/menaquinone biosynthesis C-methylase UbiE
MSVTGFGDITQQAIRVHCDGSCTTDPRVAFFDHHAPTWDDNPDDVARTLKRLEELRERIGLVAGQSVLEIGCGTGRISGWIAEQVRPGRVVAVDFSPAMLARAQKRAVPAEFRLMDICGDVSKEEQFDVAFCFHAFPHFRNHLQALRNIRSLLKPDGLLVVLHLARSTDLNHFHSQLAHPVSHDHLPAPAAWPIMLGQAGLNLVSAQDEPGLFLLKATPN